MIEDKKLSQEKMVFQEKKREKDFFVESSFFVNSLSFRRRSNPEFVIYHLRVLGSISSKLCEQLLRAQIPKVQKDCQV